jgi:transposase
MSKATWEHVLADLSSRVVLAEQALDEGSDLDAALLQPWTPPEGLGPLPDHLRERAIAVLAQQAEIEQRIGHAMDQLSRELSKVSASTASNNKISAYGETVIPKYFDNAV